MVIHEVTQSDNKVAFANKQVMKPRKYVIVKDHVREITQPENAELNDVTPQENVPSLSQPTIKKRKRKSSKTEHNQEPSAPIPTENETKHEQINKSDLEELRSVYKKCKAIVKKIESKYSHLLELDSDDYSSGFDNKRRRYNDESSSEKCNCKLNTKIVFDDSGNQVHSKSSSSDHVICSNNLAQPKLRPLMDIEIEYPSIDLSALPEDVPAMRELLKSTDLSPVDRNMILNKIKYLKEENSIELKQNKLILIEELKKDPEQHLEFKGCNLSVLKGYKYYKI